jgi:hypothetical protein
VSASDGMSVRLYQSPSAKLEFDDLRFKDRELTRQCIMMVHFAFGDENGAYQKVRSSRFIKRYPYFIRSTLLVRADEWQLLRDQIDALRSSVAARTSTSEIKWAHLWQLKRFENRRERIEPSHPLGFLSKCSFREALQYVEQCLDSLHDLSYARVILTVTDNARCQKIAEANLYKMHLQEAMQRVEMELNTNDICVVFVDAISPEQNRHLRDAYYAIYRDGDFVKRYRHILDCLNLVYSHQSVGIQIADFVAGCFSGFLRGYPEASRLFENHVVPILRTSRSGQIVGYGLREVPRDDIFRSKLREVLEPNINKAVEARRRSLFG